MPSPEGMNRIYDVGERGGIPTQVCGQTTRDHTFPLDIGSRGSCQMGSNVCTDAGGQYFCRFGKLHGTVEGAEGRLAQWPSSEFNHEQQRRL